MSALRTTRLIVAGALLAATGAQAQTRPVVAGGAYFETYSFGDAAAVGMETVSLVTLPFAASTSLEDGRVDVSLSGSFARASVSGESGDASVSGLTDVAVRASTKVLNDGVTLLGTVFLPTGNATHDAQEAVAAGALASDLLPFRISNLGAGGGLDLSALGAVPVQGWALGARVGVRLSGEFEPLEGARTPLGEAFSYQPGNQFYTRIAADRNLGASEKVSLSLTWQTFAEDQVAGTNLFRSGNRIHALASYGFPSFGGSSVLAYGGVLHRSAGEFVQVTPLTAPSSQNLLLLGANARVARGDRVWLPGVDLRLLNTDDGTGQGFTLGLGGSVEMPLAASTLVPTARLRFGSVTANEGASSSFWGLELGAALRHRLDG